MAPSTTRSRTAKAQRETFQIGRILYATDFSPASTPAFEEAVGLARLAGASLVILHVLNPVLPFILDTEARSHVLSTVRADAREALRKAVEAAKRRGVAATGLLRVGEPRDEIVHQAQRHRADLIIIGTHGRTGLKRALLGSVATGIVSGSPIPVLSVRERRPRAGH